MRVNEDTSAISRRAFGGVVLGTAVASTWRSAPAVMLADEARPALPDGVMTGDVGGGSAVVWSRTDRPARMVVEYATTESFQNAREAIGPAALGVSDFTAKMVLTDLPASQRIFYRVRFQDLSSPKVISHPVTGSFKTAPQDKTDVTFAWSGDTVGQGFGIDPARGGLLTYESIRQKQPDFFLNSGDLIYADNPVLAEVKLDDGTVWKNFTTEAKAKVAETLDEFRGNYRYNLQDDHFRKFNLEVPHLMQWDDHEVLNNWSPSKDLNADPRYKVKSIGLLAARAKRAFLESNPIRTFGDDPERIFRTLPYGPLVEVFMLDERSYRGPNTGNRQTTESADTAFLGSDQTRWLQARLARSRATWKVIASDMPIGLVVPDGPDAFENLANGDGPPLGRELELARLLRSIKENGVKNVVWLTADVHYAAAHHYHPSRARFSEFTPFWEFVAGPLHAGTFGPSKLDDTFGPEVRFTSIPPGMKPNRPPSEGHQFFGMVKIDGKTEAMTVSLHNRTGQKLYSIELPREV